jgi:hypothetical protein
MRTILLNISLNPESNFNLTFEVHHQSKLKGGWQFTPTLQKVPYDHILSNTT